MKLIHPNRTTSSMYTLKEGIGGHLNECAGTIIFDFCLEIGTMNNVLPHELLRELKE